MDYVSCCSTDKCCCCHHNEDDVETQRSISMEFIHDMTLKLRRPKSIEHASTETMDELMDDMALSQKRVMMFVPISCNISFSRYIDYFNASTVIHPFSTFRLIWDIFIMIILIFTCFEIPFTLSFGIETSNLHSSYGQFILMIDRWFIIDVITSFPFEFMFPSDIPLGGAPAILRAFRIVRMIRLFKLVRFFRMLKLVNTFLREIMGPRATVIIRLLRLVALMVMAAHFAACLWYYVGAIHYKQNEESWLSAQNVNIESKFDAYLVSIYWSIVTLFTTGYGDIIPVNQDEQMVAATVVLLGTCFFAYLIGAVGSLVAEGDRMRSIREQKLEEAQAFCANKRLPPNLSRAIITHIQYFWKRNFVYDEYEILQSLPFGIQYDLLKYHGNKTFGEFEPFNTLPSTTKGLLALKLKQFSCNKGFTVYRHGDIAKEFYIQRTGKSCLIIPQNDEIELNRGDICGHIGFVKGQRKGTLFCKTWSEFYSLSMRDLEDVLMMEHPTKWQQILNDIKKCMKTYNNKKENINTNHHHQRNKLSIDLNQIKTQKNSKLLSFLFAEDSVTRNDKILFESKQQQIDDVELTECILQLNINDNNKESSSSPSNQALGLSSLSSSPTPGYHSDNNQTYITKALPKKKQNKIMKKRKIGKQGATGSRNNRGNTATKTWKKQRPQRINKESKIITTNKPPRRASTSALNILYNKKKNKNMMKQNLKINVDKNESQPFVD